MKKGTNFISCPNCNHQMDVDSIIYNKIESESQKRFDEKFSELDKEYKTRIDSLNEEKNKFTEEQKRFENTVKLKIKEGIELEQKQLEKKAKNKVQAEIEEYQKQLNEQSEEIKQLNKTRADVVKLKREKEELRSKIEAEQEIKFNNQLKNKILEIEKAEREKNEFKISEKEIIIDNLNKKLKEAQRKIEQGSVQLQGEVQELAIENYLKEKFILDDIQEIKKGANGADCVQIVNTRERFNCGAIYYESKRTKEFNNKWIPKFKEDMRAKNASVGVIVTQSMPKGMDRMGLKEDIWICSFEEFKNLSYVLREYIVKIKSVMISQDNKDSKMEQLYGYLTSDSFKLQVDAIIKSYEEMRADLAKEKKYLEGIWKRREKQTDKVLKSSIEIYTSVKNIAGSVIQDIESLKLPLDEENI